MRILILGGTTEASRLAEALAGRAGIEPLLSYAGRTKELKPQPVPVRVGGFGGIEGLTRFLRIERIDMLVDATHPFAAQMSTHATAAASATKVPLVAFTRAPWAKIAGDDWVEVADNAGALAALGTSPRHVFLTIGRLGIGDFRLGPPHHYLIRAIDPPPDADLPPDHRLILARGTFKLADEVALMRDERIDVLVSKNSGGEATYAKVAAARELGLPVIMVSPPARPGGTEIHSLADCLAWIEAHGSTFSIGTERRV